jgi:hypothetical protein
MEPWMQKEIDRLLMEYGTVPPPWVVYNEHPYNIGWRMGFGQTHILTWWEWWAQQRFGEDQKIEYFRRWPPPHCWLAFLIQAIWDIDPYEEKDQLPRYFDRTNDLGFGSQQDFEQDLNDAKWLKRDP